MKIGLLICDHVRPELVKEFGTYQTMFHQLLKDAAKSISLEIEIVDYWVIDNQFPEDLNECDVYLGTGSKFSVNDKFPWVIRIKKFVKDLYQNQKPFFGICFGHQLIAAALDGEVAVSDKGWGVGVTQLKVLSNNPEFKQLNGSLTLRVSHKEQVIKIPSNTKVLASNEFCETFMIQTGDCFLGIQGHPEFSAGYAEGLIRCREGIIPKDTAIEGTKSLKKPVDNDLIMQIALRFLQKCA